MRELEKYHWNVYLLVVFICLIQCKKINSTTQIPNRPKHDLCTYKRALQSRENWCHCFISQKIRYVLIVMFDSRWCTLFLFTQIVNVSSNTVRIIKVVYCSELSVFQSTQFSKHTEVQCFYNSQIPSEFTKPVLEQQLNGHLWQFAFFILSVNTTIKNTLQF